MKKFLSVFLISLGCFSVQAKEPVVEIIPEYPSYRARLEGSLKQVQEAYLKLPRGRITRDDILKFEKDVDHLRTLVATIRLGDFSVAELARPLDILDEFLRKLPRKPDYTEGEIAPLRKWSGYLLKEPLLRTFLAKENVILGRMALDEKKYDEAQKYFQDALAELRFLRKNADRRLKKPLSRIESEITILFDAARHGKHLEAQRAENIVSQLTEAFNTYHEIRLNIWNGIEPPFP